MGLTKSLTSTQPALFSPTSHTPMRWSDIVAERKSTHPDAVPIKLLLNTTELLEAVLCYLPPNDILIMQRLCKRGRDVVKVSSPLQMVLFFCASKDKNVETWVLDSDGNLHVGNEASEVLSKAPAFGKQPLDLKPAICAPLILYKYRPDYFSNFETRLDYLRKHCPTSHEHFKLQHKNVPLAASCRPMLLTQPPVTTFNVEIEGMRKYPSGRTAAGCPRGSKALSPGSKWRIRTG